MELTVTVSDDLAARLRPVQDQIPDMLEQGLRERLSRQVHEYAGLSGILESLAGLPTAEEVLALRPSSELDHRLDELLAKSKTTGLTEEEQREWEAYEYVEHLVRLAKARAQRRLKSAS